MVASGGGHTSLIPPLAFACRISEAVQHGGYLIIAMSHGHPADDLQRLHRRRGFSRRTRSLHRELGMRTALPMNRELKSLFLQILIPTMLQLAGRETIPGIYRIILLKSLSSFVFQLFEFAGQSDALGRIPGA